jgi:uncharacterized membrane protein YoaK (UPF0700 family)
MIGLARDARFGTLPPLLVLLTLSTGLVDAVTFLRLGHVFVANMTGNVVFLAFALGGSTEFSVPLSLTALVLFLAGAAMGGRLSLRHGAHRERQVAVACALQASLVAGAFAVSVWADARGVHVKDMVPGYVMVGSLGVAMGLQNATVRSIGVPGLTTTVLTSTLTGLAADSRWGAATGFSRLGFVAVILLFIGAAAGALLVLNSGVSAALGIATTLLAATSIVAYCLPHGAPAAAHSDG